MLRDIRGAGNSLEPEDAGHRFPASRLEVVVEAGERDGPPHGPRRDYGPYAPPPHEQTLVHQLLYRGAYGGAADPQPRREFQLALELAPPRQATIRYRILQ